MKFTKATEQFPDQVLRYAATASSAAPSSSSTAPARSMTSIATEEESLEDAEEEEEEEILTGKGDKIDPRGVLWISSRGQLDADQVPACPCCKSDRRFEFQVSFLFLLETECIDILILDNLQR